MHADTLNKSLLATRGIRRGFSLIELVIVVVIIGIIAAIAIPRMSRGSAGAAESALSGNLSVLRNAIDLYQSEHEGKFPPTANFADQMLQYSNVDGSDVGTKDTAAGRIYGPYMRKVPVMPVGGAAEKGTTGVAAAAAAGVAWIYTEADGTVKANATGNDTAGKAYNAY